MGIVVELLPESTIEGTGDSEVFQDVCDTVDTSRYASGVVSARCLGKYLCTLKAQGSDDGQSFVDLTSLLDNDNIVAYLNKAQPPGSVSRLYRYIRWAVKPDQSALNWYTCGRITLTLK